MIQNDGEVEEGPHIINRSEKPLEIQANFKSYQN